MATPQRCRWAAPVTAAAAEAVAAAAAAAAASARAAGRLEESAALVAAGKVAMVAALQLASGDECVQAANVAEVAMRMEVIERDVVDKVLAGAQGRAAKRSGRQRAARNVAEHWGLGAGPAATAAALERPQASQRGRRSTATPEPHESDSMSASTNDKGDHGSDDPLRGVLSNHSGVKVAIKPEQQEAQPEQPVTDLRLDETLLHDDASTPDVADVGRPCSNDAGPGLEELWPSGQPADKPESAVGVTGGEVEKATARWADCDPGTESSCSCQGSQETMSHADGGSSGPQTSALGAALPVGTDAVQSMESENGNKCFTLWSSHDLAAVKTEILRGLHRFKLSEECISLHLTADELEICVHSRKAATQLVKCFRDSGIEQQLVAGFNHLGFIHAAFFVVRDR